MKITVQLDHRLLSEARTFAADTGRTLDALIEDALRQALARRDSGVSRKYVRLTTFGGTGPRPGVKLDSNSVVADLVEGR